MATKSYSIRKHNFPKVPATLMCGIEFYPKVMTTKPKYITGFKNAAEAERQLIEMEKEDACTYAIVHVEESFMDVRDDITGGTFKLLVEIQEQEIITPHVFRQSWVCSTGYNLGEFTGANWNRINAIRELERGREASKQHNDEERRKWPNHIFGLYTKEEIEEMDQQANDLVYGNKEFWPRIKWSYAIRSVHRLISQKAEREGIKYAPGFDTRIEAERVVESLRVKYPKPEIIDGGWAKESSYDFDVAFIRETIVKLQDVETKELYDVRLMITEQDAPDGQWYVRFA